MPVVVNPEVLAARRRNHAYIAALRNRLLVAERMEPQDWQAAHSPTEPVMVKVSAARDDDELTRRRKIDKRLWEAMTVEQEQAAMDIAHAFTLITGDIAVGVANYGTRGARRTGASVHETDRAVALQEAYFDWGRRCLSAGISHSAAMDVLAFGIPVSEIGCLRKKAAPWARKNLFRALSMYCRVKGWQVPAVEDGGAG